MADQALSPPVPSTPAVDGERAGGDLVDDGRVSGDRVLGGGGAAVVRSGALSMVGLIALGGTRILHGTLVVRAADEATFARVGTLIGLAMTASLFLPGGLASAASRFIPFHRGRSDLVAARAAYRLLSLVGAGCALGLGVLVGLIASVGLDVSTADAVGVGLLTAVYSGYSVAKGALYGFDRVVPYTWLEIAGSVVAVLATVVVVVTGGGAYLAPLTIGYAVLMFGSLWILRPTRGEPGVRVAAPGRRELGHYVWLASLGGVASAGLLQILPVFAHRFTSTTEVTYIVAAVTLVAPLYFLPRALGMALFPAMARAHGAGDADAVRRHADLSTRALLALLAPLFGGALLVSREVLAIYGGPSADLAPGAPVLQLILLATYVAVIQVAAVNSLSSGDGVRIPVYSAVVGAVAGLVVLYPLGHWFGGVGIGLTYLVAVATGAAGPLVAAWRRFDMAWAGPAVRAFAVIGGALVVALVIDALDLSGGLRVFVDILAAVVVTVLGGLVLRRDLMSIAAARHTA